MNRDETSTSTFVLASSQFTPTFHVLILCLHRTFEPALMQLHVLIHPWFSYLYAASSCLEYLYFQGPKGIVGFKVSSLLHNLQKSFSKNDYSNLRSLSRPQQKLLLFECEQNHLLPVKIERMRKPR